MLRVIGTSHIAAESVREWRPDIVAVDAAERLINLCS